MAIIPAATRLYADSTFLVGQWRTQDFMISLVYPVTQKITGAPPVWVEG